MPLEAVNLSFAYRPQRPVLRDVSLRLEPGTITGLVGPNGAGKSTLLRLLVGVLAPTQGGVNLDGAPIASMDHRERARRVAYVSQQPSLAFAFTVRRYVALGRFATGGSDGFQAVEAALGASDLSDRADEPFGTLSAGQQQRASVARALGQFNLPLGCAVGRTLIVDERVSAQDPRHALQIVSLLRGMAVQGLTVVLALHDLALAARVCDRAAVLDADGRLAAQGPVAAALNPDVLGPVFGVRFDGAMVASLPTRT